MCNRMISVAKDSGKTEIINCTLISIDPKALKKVTVTILLSVGFFFGALVMLAIANVLILLAL